jgi:hypothetical protein
MLFPVFARARESARKIQCLSNVKNIAAAIQMYLTDYDRLPPKEHNAAIQAAFDDYGGRESGGCQYPTYANPYLRWPVVLDEYVKNRDVWRCPSAGRVPRTSICPTVPDWWTVTLSHQDEWGCYGSICTGTFPPGWGGDVTDSWAQQVCPTSRTETSGGVVGAFEQTLGYPEQFEVKTSAMDDPAKFLVVGETGAIDTLWDAAQVAYPDVCGLGCTLVGGVCWWDSRITHADWVNCSWSQECGAGDLRLGTDVEYRKKFAKARHLGGDNLGFADGHATWMNAEAIISGTKPTLQTKPGTSVVWGYFGPVGQPNESSWAITGGIRACTYPCCRQGG